MNATEISAKDSIRTDILSAVLDGRAEMTVYLESDGRDAPYSEIRDGKGPAFRHNNFSVNETPDGYLTLIPVVVGCLAVITATLPPSFGSGKVEVIRKGAPSPDVVLDLRPGVNRIVLSPIDMKKYSMAFEPGREGASGAPLAARQAPEEDDATARDGQADALRAGNAALQGDIAILEREIADLKERRAALSARKRALASHLEWLSSNSGEDGEAELSELKGTFGVDEEIISHYLSDAGEEAMKLVEDVRSGIRRLEDQIREFVEKKALRTREIEKSLKTGGR
ncbi:MAG: hypothetical protein LBQ19_00280 [Synergistaceae bacterium]|jgi:hypothetical protein|nr:hypothetical protein [Synergistaceae bacterium]